MRLQTCSLVALVLSLGLSAHAAAQGSQQALALDGVAGAVRFAVDDDVPGAGSFASDVGAGDFTIELWLRGTLADNPTASAGGDVELPVNAWLSGNVVYDRSAAATGRELGISIAGGRVRFGTGTGDAPGIEAGHTLEGSTLVLDGEWHHVACVRAVATGEKRIYVDGALDFASTLASSTADLSYPDGGTGAGAANAHLSLGGAKDAGVASFRGSLDEVRIWSKAASEGDVLSWYDRIAVPTLEDLAADYRLEEGSGVITLDQSAAGSAPGLLVGGAVWRSYFAAAKNTAPISSGLLPFGFRREKKLTGLVQPTSFRILPDGRFLICERAGNVLIYDGAATKLVLSVPTSLATIEYGIVGIELDPAFALNGWFYLHYTSLAPRDRVSRFTLAPGDTVAPASEVVLWENADLGPGHTGGSISFGPDGKLYIPTGDAFFPPNSQDLTNANGKVLRINPDGTIPPDNPGALIPGADPAIWAIGLRNPFRSGWHLPTGKLWIADVGGDDASAYEELHLGAPGANYGWPDQEGPECVVADCSGMTPPVYSYRHDDLSTAPVFPSGSITGGLVYEGTSFPAGFQGNYFFGDYANRWIRRLRFDAAGDPIDAPVVVPYLVGGTLVELDVDAAGDLWYLTIGLPWTGGPDEAALYRVSYTPPADPAPISTIVLHTTPPGLKVALDGYLVTTPFAFQTRAGYAHELEAPASQASGVTPVSFVCWSDGGAAKHSITAPAGGMNVAATYGPPGAACADGCGFSTYGHGLGGANVLGLVGGSGAAVGGTLVTKTTGLAPGAPVWVGVAPASWQLAILGGTVLIDSSTQFATVSLPSAGGEAVWSVTLPSTPSLAGAAFYLQSLALDAGTAFGLAFSNGLKLELCP